MIRAGNRLVEFPYGDTADLSDAMEVTMTLADKLRKATEGMTGGPWFGGLGFEVRNEYRHILSTGGYTSNHRDDRDVNVEQMADRDAICFMRNLWPDLLVLVEAVERYWNAIRAFNKTESGRHEWKLAYNEMVEAEKGFDAALTTIAQRLEGE